VADFKALGSFCVKQAGVTPDEDATFSQYNKFKE